MKVKRTFLPKCPKSLTNVAAFSLLSTIEELQLLLHRYSASASPGYSGCGTKPALVKGTFVPVPCITV